MNNEYFGKVVRWVDGDTVILDTYQETVLHQTWAYGKLITTTMKVEEANVGYRLIIVDTPEKGQLGYRESTAYANLLAPPGTEVRLLTHGQDNAGWGRTLADVFPYGSTTGMSEMLLRTWKHAKVWVPR